MSGIAWLILSWVLVGIICYLIVFKLGRQSSSSSTSTISSDEKGNENHKRGLNNSLLESYTTDEKSKFKNASFWANAFINWIYSYSGIKFRQFHLELLNAIDDAARRLLHDEHYDLRIDKNGLEEGQIEPPEISNLQLLDGPVDQISGRAHIFIKRATLKLLTSKRKNDKFIVNNYEVLLTNINANIDLRIATIAGHTHLIICFSEAPTSEIMLYDIEEGRVTGPEAVEIHDIISKAIGASIVNFKMESLISNEKGYNTSHPSSDVNDIVKRFYRSTDNAEQNNSSPPLNKLHVNVIRAYDLSINDSNQQPFVVIEMDEPQRKYITNFGQSSSPNWNEGFDFDLSGGSDEILFEIYNPSTSGGGSSTDNTFLGLAIVGINELIKTNNPTQYLKLQGRPYHNDNVNGTLLVEFTFSYDPNVSLIGTHTSQTRVINRDGDQFSETIKHSIRPLGDSNFNHLEQPIPTKTTTVTVKGVQRPDDGLHASLYDSYMNYDPHDAIESDRRHPSEEHSQSTIVNRQVSIHGSQQSQQLSQQQQQHPNLQSHQQHQQQRTSLQHQQHPNLQPQYQQPGTPLTKEAPLNTPDNKANTFTYDHNELPPYMNRPLANSRSGSEKRKRERSFFGDLKDRLNKKRKSYGRSKSADPATSPNLQETESSPPSRDQSQGPYSGREYDDHARYAGDDSKCTLVLELQRAGETKYILIPPTIAREPAAASILKKGKKLHLCQNHTFVAVKSSCGISCNACNGKIASGFNKQAYQCRACRMVCHKACHTHIQAPCINKNPMQLASAKDIDWAHYLRHSQIGEYISAENL